MNTIYLDHNATTPILPEVAAAIAECQQAVFANPSSQHQPGRRARQVFEEARETVAAILKADLSSRPPDRVIFTSGGTEANNLVIGGLAGDTPGEAIISAIEHPSVAGPVEHIERRGWRVHRLGVSRAGIVQVEQTRALINDRTRLVSVMLGNNETGVVQPISTLAEICAAGGVPLHTDAAQVVGKLPVDFRALGVSALSLAAHKFHGPVGIGALVARGDLRLSPILHGGFQQDGLRPGTEPVALAVGLARALEIYAAQAESRRQRLGELRERFEALIKAGYPAAVVNGQEAQRLPHTSSVAFVGLDRQALLMALDLAGIACSTGSACASGSSEPSGVLLAMGCEKEIAASSLRFSLGAGTTVAEVDEAVRRIVAVCERLIRAGRARRSLKK